MTAADTGARGDRRRRTTGYLLVILAATCWATGGLLAKWLFNGSVPIGPAQLSAARAVVAFIIIAVSLAIAGAVRRRDLLRVRLADLPFLAVFGVCGLALVHFTYFAAIEFTNVPTAILLEYLASVIVLIVSVAFLKERLTWVLPVGVAAAIVGCALMVGAIGGGELTVSPVGIAWGLASAVFFAAYTLMGKWAAPRFAPWTLLTYGLGFASLFWLIVVGPGPIVEVMSERTSAVAVTVMAVVATIVPFGAYLMALSRIGATQASVTATLEPVIAGVLAYAIPSVNEPLAGVQLLGAALVLAAVLLVHLPVGEKRPGVAAIAEEPAELPPVL